VGGALAAGLLTVGAVHAAEEPDVVAAGPPPFAHVVVVVFENRPAEWVFGNREAPTFNRLARRYATLGDYHGVAHPSLPNYLALVSGSTHGIHHDCARCIVHGPSLADTLQASGRRWKTYVGGTTVGDRRVSHSVKARLPFLFFAGDVRSARAHMVPLSRFRIDRRRNELPDFSLVVPSLCDDVHNCALATGDRWLRRFVEPLLHSRSFARTVLFAVFDESRGTDHRGGGGRVAAIVVSPLVRPGSRTDRPLDHYSLLRTVEDAWRLPRLGSSADANPIVGIWRTPLPRVGDPGAGARARR
jgi:phosphatidylinositol-3-phosphatase